MNRKIVIWCGNAPNQKALANKIAAQFTVAGIVIESKSSTGKRKSPLQLFNKIIDRLRFGSIYKSWSGMLSQYDHSYPSWPHVRTLPVSNINSAEAESFTKDLAPDLIVVSGTSLIKSPLLDIPAGIGIINLHTGLSPYVKGGPNCTNWCIANGEWQNIGNTIMWINAGIDSGNLIATETIDIRNVQSLLDVQKNVMEHAHELYIRAIEYLLHSDPPYQALPQSSFGKAKLYYTKMWTAGKKASLLKNWRMRKSAVIKDRPVTVSLPVK